MTRLLYAPDLVEESVLLAERTMTTPDRKAFRRERDRLYERHADDQRDEAFRLLHQRWFVRAGLHLVVQQVVGEQAGVADRLAEGRVLRSLTRAGEGADLVDRVMPDRSDEETRLVIRLCPPTLLEATALRGLLRHELMHVADMLDPAFGYQRSLPDIDDGPSSRALVCDRYRVVWDVTVDGRLARAGAGLAGARATRWREFSATFPMLCDRCRAVFDDWFDRRRPTHAALETFARFPDRAAPS